MTRWVPGALLAAFITFFLIANRGAYQGYFQDDELDNLSWTRSTTFEEFPAGLLSPRFSPHNFRPVGSAYFFFAGRAFDLRFPPYVGILHGIHFINVILLWLVLRRFGFDIVPAAFGTLLFGFHMASFDVYWKPMYVFDLLCATCVLISLLLWMRGRWVLSFIAFWCAYKSKEHAIALPVVLACYEYWFGERRWKQLIPFFAASLSFGMQAILFNPNLNNSYSLRFGPADIWKSARFYADRLLMIPYAGFAVVAAAAVVKDKRYRFGVAALCLLVAAMLAVPGRLFAAYWYVALAGLAIASAAIASRIPALAVVALAAAWIPYQYHHLRSLRRAALTVAHENRAYVDAIRKEYARHPQTEAIVFDGIPPHMARWGVEGAIHLVFRNGLLPVIWAEDLPRKQIPNHDVLLLNWDTITRTMITLDRSAPEASYFKMNRSAPVWQLGPGWFGNDGGFRWAQPEAIAYLMRPEGATKFEVQVNAGEPYLKGVRKGELEVRLDGAPVGVATFTEIGWRTIQFPLPPGKGGRVKVTFLSRPGLEVDGYKFGTPIGGFGFR